MFLINLFIGNNRKIKLNNKMKNLNNIVNFNKI